MSLGAVELLPGAGSRLEPAATDAATELAQQGAGEGPARALSPTRLVWRRFRRDRVAMASLVFVVLLVVVAFAAPLIVKLAGLPGPSVQNPNLTNAFGSPLGPSLATRSASTRSVRTSPRASSTAPACRCWSASSAPASRRCSA